MSKFITNQNEVRVPTLLIGIGGIGGRILCDVYDQISENDKKYIRMLVLDTNINDLSDVIEKGIDVIQTSENRTVQNYLATNEDYVEWFPTNKFINAKNLIDGAGQIRAVSRLGALASESSGRFEKIKEAIYELHRNYGSKLTKAVKVMIVGSITGGTGSGIGVQLPFYIREIINQESESPDILIRGLFLTSDITSKINVKDENKKAMHVNGYAFIRELNAFYKAQGIPDDEIKVSVEHYNKGVHNEGLPEELHSSNQIPYNFMFLLETSANNNTNIGAPETYEKQAAKIVKTQLFSPIGPKQYSEEDNLIIGYIENQGMDRYCGAGYATVKYPKVNVERYCSLKYTETLIKDFWLYFEKKFRLDDKIQRSKMVHNPELRPLDRAIHFITSFDEMTERVDAPAEIAMLKSEILEEVVIKNKSGGEKKGLRPTVDIVTEAIKELIEVTESDKRFEEDFKKGTIELSEDRLAEKEDAKTEVARVLSNLAMYEENTKKLVNELAIVCAGKILPFNVDAAKDVSEKEKYNLYARLKRMHPLTARYMLYKMHKWCVDEKRRVDADVEAFKVSCIGKDYNPFNEGDQSPTAAISDFIGRAWFKSIGDAVSGKYRTVIELIKTSLRKERNRIPAYRHSKLTSLVYDHLIESIEKLIDIYEGFFVGLDDLVAKNETEINAFESKEQEIVSGDKLVCADGQCVKALFEEVLENAQGNMMSASDKMKTGIFEYIYKMFEKLPEKSKRTVGDENKLRDATVCFNDYILPQIEVDVLKYGEKVIDMSAFEAIKKEYEIYAAAEDAEGRKMQLTLQQYIQSVFSVVSNLAIPYLEYSDARPNEILSDEDSDGAKNKVSQTAVYWGANKSALALYQNNVDGSVDNNKFLALLGTPDQGHYSTLINSSFSPYEVICYKVVYGLLVENLAKYRKTSECYKEYHNRLRNVVRKSARISKNESGELSTVHPHIDKRWHNRAYLPKLNEAENVIEATQELRAFIMGLGFEKVQYATYDYENCWCFNEDAEFYPIKHDGEILRSRSFSNLYDAFAYNEVIVEKISKVEESEKSEAKEKFRIEDYNVSDEERIKKYFEVLKEQKIIKIFVGKKQEKQELPSNIIDIMCEIDANDGDEQLIEDILDFTKSYIFDYCMLMCGNKEGLSTQVSSEIYNLICKESKNIKSAPIALRKRVEGCFGTKVEESEAK